MRKGGRRTGELAKGGLNRVPLPDLPPSPARGRTRTLRWNYLPSLPSLDCPLCVRQIDSVDIIRLFRISKQFSRRLLQIIWSNDVQLHLNQLPDLASTATSCAALPQPRSSRLLAANTRAAGGAWGARMTCTRVSIACSVYLRASDLISVGAKGI